MKRYTGRQTAGFFVVLAVIVVIAFFGLMLRDYDFSLEGGPHFEAKEFIPKPGSFAINNNMPGKIIVTVPKNSRADGYEVMYSLLPNMLFGRSFAASFENNKRELSLLFKGSTYYIKVRYYKKNDANRKVNGQWTDVKSARVRG